MNDKLFTWVREHLNDDTAKLRLKYGAVKDGDIDYAAAITQIECRRKFGKKLADTLASFPDFFFPTVLAGEQASSDIVASFHASLIPEAMPAADMTAGLGIDAFHIATRASGVVAVERDSDRAEALRYNAEGLRIDNFELVSGDCNDFIDRCITEKRHFGAVFIDPARRAGDGSRVFALADCEPDLTAMMPRLSEICDLLIIKASPMLDISHTAGAISPVPYAIMAVGTPTECKELLILVDFRTQTEEPLIEAVTLRQEGSEIFSFKASVERDTPAPEIAVKLSEGAYIYEASPSLMKTGAFKLLAREYGLSIFHPNTRLFTSENFVKDFPGTAYRVIKVMPYASRVIKRFAREYPQVEVATRNFGMSADALRAKLGVRDGGSMRLYGITDSKGERLLVLTEAASQAV